MAPPPRFLRLGARATTPEPAAPLPIAASHPATNDTLRTLPLRMNPSYRNSPSPSDSDGASTSGSDNSASEGSSTSTIVDVVETLSSAKLIKTQEDDAQTAPATTIQAPAIAIKRPHTCFCGTNLARPLEFADARKHLDDVHGLKSTRTGRKAMMACPWPGCVKTYTVCSAPRHLLDQHVDPAGKGARRRGGQRGR
ncbi:unnamed protein product [Peniophora sp. CBMAI 1063]|nr:unnamed protein product [Peniophora sp. CBMAI 1063]